MAPDPDQAHGFFQAGRYPLPGRITVAVSIWIWRRPVGTLVGMKRVILPSILVAAVAIVVAQSPQGPQDQPSAKTEKWRPVAATTTKKTPVRVLGQRASLKRPGHQLDFPDICRDPQGTLWVCYIEHDGTEDVLWLAKRSGANVEPVAKISDPGILHQPAITCAGDGPIWCFWGQTGDGDVVHLMGAKFADGSRGEILPLAKSAGSDTFADAGVDRRGRVWVAWQSMRSGEGDIYARVLEPGAGRWSDEIPVATGQGGDWEPRLAFDKSGSAWVLFDSSRGNEFNLYLTRVPEPGGRQGELFEIAHSPRYEARGDIIADADGGGFWIAAERGRVRWGLDVRGHGAQKGLNAQRDLVFGHFDLETKEFAEFPVASARKLGAPVNLPVLGLDAAGDPWVAYRFFSGAFWRIGLARFDVGRERWSVARALPDSNFGQDRRAGFCSGADGSPWLAWPSDGRSNKTCLVSGVFLGQIGPGVELPDGPAGAPPVAKLGEPFAASQSTPERPANDRHHWEHGGKRFGLYWGDVHRHTDVSNCRTGTDGCITEQFRYAYDMAKLDFLGTSDHTDAAKKYDPYEWWHNQRMADVFQAPEQFLSLYVYEREQRWPWGHRNVVFAQRGGPVVYIRRDLYRNSPWQQSLPAKNGLREINPPELWQILRAYGKPVALVSHTGATGMGTDWGRYDEIDHEVENLVEIFQGARVSYEGRGAPQPTAGLRPGEGYTIASGKEKAPPPPQPIDDFGKHAAGLYQNALAQGHRLGVFASSDHISQHVAYGGVYLEEFTREGIIAAFRQRRTIAATDKIYLEFSCNGQPLGSIFQTGEKPALSIRVDGTANLRKVTVVRNEEDHHVIEAIGGHLLETSYTDEDPPDGEVRYYIRVEQEDGNMAWSSPVWVTVE